MRKMVYWVLLFFTSILTGLLQERRVSSASQSSTFSATTKVVETNFGKIKGRLVNLNVHGLPSVEQYLGVPYGQAPTGEKRFVMPQTTSKWTNLPAKDATNLPPVCIQTLPQFWTKMNEAARVEALKRMPESTYERYKRSLEYLKKESEDCLYLNIYVPGRKGNKNPSPLLPVLVLVHGESFDWGTGNAYNGSLLASYGQIIVVTLNYRLGAFGFLSSGDAVCKGNWALADISCALEFLRTVIGDFGGDKHAITLLGWDAGAVLVNLLMSSPISAPADSRLFKRAVLFGGNALSSTSTVKNPAENFQFLAENVGCPTSITNEFNRNEMLTVQNISNCIRSRSVENITTASQQIDPPTFRTLFGPVIDGIFVSNDPAYNLEHHSALFQDLDLMVGVTNHEAFNYLSQKEAEFGIDVTKRDAVFRTLVRNLYNFHRTEIFYAILDQYTDWTDPKYHPNMVRNSVLDALSDGLYVAPMIKLARLHAKRSESEQRNDGRSGSDGSSRSSPSGKRNTYLYLFNYETRALKRGTVQGSVHGEDLMYILGYPLMDKNHLSKTQFNLKFEDNERYLSEAFMRHVVNFVKFGDPNRLKDLPKTSNNDILTTKFERIHWSPFEADVRETYLRISTEPRMDFYYRAHDVAFWNRFLPSLEESGRKERNEEHHLLPDHFIKTSYFGVVQPYVAAKIPFPPPPLPPTTMPVEVTTKLKELKEKRKSSDQENDKHTSTVAPAGAYPVQEGYYSTILSVTVAVGCALLILNILIFAGIYHQRDKQRKQNAAKAAAAATYQSYDVGVANTYSLGSPITPQGPRMPLPPPPPAPVNASLATAAAGIGNLNGSSADGDLHPTLSANMSAMPGGGMCTAGLGHPLGHSHQHHHAMFSHDPVTPHAFYAEQEPLLRRTIVSPTCPRHGKAAAAAAAAAASSSGGGGGGMATMEEIQV